MKKFLHNACNDYIVARIRRIEEDIAELQLAANEETKSSAGDKYETGRAMAQLEIDKSRDQLNEANTLLRSLLQISPLVVTPAVQQGSVVMTSQGNFYIAIPAGKIETNEGTFIAVSQGSPIGKCMLGLSAGNGVTFNNRHMEILKVY